MESITGGKYQTFQDVGVFPLVIKNIECNRQVIACHTYILLSSINKTVQKR